MNKELAVMFIKLFIGLCGIVAFIWLFIMDWKIALAMFFIIWGNNAGFVK